MPRANRAGRAGPEPEAEADAGAGAAGGARACAHGRLSASCGTIHVDLPPCVLLLPRRRPAPAPPAPPRPPLAQPRPSCSYHLLPESHRVLPFVCHQVSSVSAAEIPHLSNVIRIPNWHRYCLPCLMITICLRLSLG